MVKPFADKFGGIDVGVNVMFNGFPRLVRYVTGHTFTLEAFPHEEFLLSDGSQVGSGVETVSYKVNQRTLQRWVSQLGTGILPNIEWVNVWEDSTYLGLRLIRRIDGKCIYLVNPLDPKNTSIRIERFKESEHTPNQGIHIRITTAQESSFAEDAYRVAALKRQEETEQIDKLTEEVCHAIGIDHGGFDGYTLDEMKSLKELLVNMGKIK